MMNVDASSTVEAVEAMARRLREGAMELEALAAKLKSAQDVELAAEAVAVVVNLVPNLRLDLLVTRPLKAAITAARTER